MKIRTDASSINLSTGERTRKVVGDGQTIDEKVSVEAQGRDGLLKAVPVEKIEELAKQWMAEGDVAWADELLALAAVDVPVEAQGKPDARPVIGPNTHRGEDGSVSVLGTSTGVDARPVTNEQKREMELDAKRYQQLLDDPETGRHLLLLLSQAKGDEHAFRRMQDRIATSKELSKVNRVSSIGKPTPSEEGK